MDTPRPLLVYDGECGLCLRLVRWLRRLSVPGSLDLKPYQELPLSPLRQRLAPRTVLLVTPDGSMAIRGAAVLSALTLALPRWRPVWQLLRLPPLRQVIDLGYCWIARNRSAIGRWLDRQQ